MKTYPKPYRATDDVRFAEILDKWNAIHYTFELAKDLLNKEVDKIDTLIRKEKQDKIDSLVWNYSLKTVELFDRYQWQGEENKNKSEWLVICADTETDIPEDHGSYSGFRKHHETKPFKFVNDVFVYHSEGSGYYVPTLTPGEVAPGIADDLHHGNIPVTLRFKDKKD